MRAINLVFAALTACACSTAGGSGVWTITTVDFAQRQALLRSIGPGGVVVAAAGGGQEENIPYDRLLRLDRGPTGVLPNRWTVYLRNGDRIVGMAQGVKGETLKWRGALLGDLDLPLQGIRAIAQSNRPWDEFDAVYRQDTVLLRNGDTVRGIVADITGARLSLSVGNDLVAIPMDTVVCAYMADVAQPAEKHARAMRLDLADGSRISASSILTVGEELNAELAGGARRTLRLSDVQRIAQVNGPLSWLSDRRPVASEHRPYFEGSFPVRMDRTLTGEPIVIEKRPYERGIAVHSYSRLSWDLDGTYKAFRTRYAIDPTQARTEKADVTVRIYADDRLVHEQKGFRAANKLSSPVLVDLSGASRLTLEVDYGANYDVQDRLIWVEPALLRDMPKSPRPAAATSTQPATTASEPQPADAGTAQPR